MHVTGTVLAHSMCSVLVIITHFRPSNSELIEVSFMNMSIISANKFFLSLITWPEAPVLTPEL